MLIWVVAPDLNKQPDVQKPAETAVHHQVQLIQEIEQPQLSKTEEAVTQVTDVPTTPTVPTPTPVVAKPKGCEAYRDEVAKYNWNVNIAMAVMEGESTNKGIPCDKNAVGDDRPIGGLHAVSCGLFQIRTLKGRPSCEQLKDPATNIAWAYKLYQSPRGWKHWTVFNKGIYKKYM